MERESGGQVTTSTIKVGEGKCARSISLQNNRATLFGIGVVFTKLNFDELIV